MIQDSLRCTADHHSFDSPAGEGAHDHEVGFLASSKESKLFKSLVATFVVIFLGGPAVALAGTASYFADATKTTVSYADLNLEREEDVRELYRRLQYASRKVCRDTSPGIAGPIVRRVCYRETLSHVVDKFDNEDLARVHAR